MTAKNEMPGVIWAVPYEDMGNGEWDESKWIKCPFVENDKRPKYETQYHHTAKLIEAIGGMKRTHHPMMNANSAICIRDDGYNAALKDIQDYLKERK